MKYVFIRRVSFELIHKVHRGEFQVKMKLEVGLRLS